MWAWPGICRGRFLWATFQRQYVGPCYADLMLVTRAGRSCPTCQPPKVAEGVDQGRRTWPVSFLDVLASSGEKLLEVALLEVGSQKSRRERTNPSWHIENYWSRKTLLLQIGLAKFAECPKTSNSSFPCQLAAAWLHLLLAMPPPRSVVQGHGLTVSLVLTAHRSGALVWANATRWALVRWWGVLRPDSSF